MKKKDFKFELGQFVKHATADEHIGIKMKVVSRGFMECTEGTDEAYMVSFYDYGQPQRAKLNHDELTEY